MNNSGPDNPALSSLDEIDVAALKRGSAYEIERLLLRVWTPLTIRAEIITGDRPTAEDVVQDSLIRALARIDTFEDRGAGSLYAWLRKIVFNQAISAIRSVNRRREDSLEILESDLDRGIRVPTRSTLITPSTEDLVADEQTRTLVLNAIGELPELLRLPLLLRDIEGFSTKEAAELLKTTQSNVRTRLHRGRQALKSRLEVVLGESS